MSDDRGGSKPQQRSRWEHVCGGDMTIKPGRAILACALVCGVVFATPVAGLSMEYRYRGNPFDGWSGVAGFFSPTDHVTARFTVDCAAAHSEADCRGLPYDDYFSLGAIHIDSMRFSAGPVALPTADGRGDVSVFSFSTDYMGRIVDWDMDLFLPDSRLNVDTDNVNGGTDSAGAPAGSANVTGNPGIWGNKLSTSETGFDLVVSKTVDNPVPQGPQQRVEFNVSIVNKGPGAAADVVVVDTLPPELSLPEGLAAYTSSGYYDEQSGRWELGTLDDNLPRVLKIPAVITAEHQPPCIVNRADTATEGDSHPGDNEASVAVRRQDTQGCSDLIIEDIFLYRYDTPCQADVAVGFQIRVRNAGPDVAKNVALDITEPLFHAPGLTIDDANCSGMRCTWSVIEVGQAQTASGVSEHISINGMSEEFNVVATEFWEIHAELRLGEGEDYDPSNDTHTERIEIRPHDRDPVCDRPPGGDDWDLSGAGADCFIATASYGSRLHPHVQTLRNFRDDVLMRTAAGRSIVRFYYLHSPEIARYISEREHLRAAVRLLLTPLVLAIAYPLLTLSVLLSAGILSFSIIPKLRMRRA